jgi:chromosome segregation ATPase
MGETQTTEQTTQQTTQQTTAAPEKLAMTQAELDALIAGRVGQALAQADKKRANVPAEAVKELEELRAEKAERARQELERKGEYQKALDAQREAIESKHAAERKTFEEASTKLSQRVHKEVVVNSLLGAAAAGNAVAPEQVVALLQSQVKLNEEFEPQVIDANGNPRFAQDGKPMTPAQLVDDFLKGNPHFVKANARTGDAKGGQHSKGGGDVSPITALEAQIDELAAKVLTGSIDAVAKHNKAVQELKKLKAGTQ